MQEKEVDFEYLIFKTQWSVDCYGIWWESILLTTQLDNNCAKIIHYMSTSAQ